MCRRTSPASAAALRLERHTSAVVAALLAGSRSLLGSACCASFAGLGMLVATSF
jgi:hypothetical protein